MDASHSSTGRSSSGCWTCRLRRKKCDEKYPSCSACTTLHITCHYQQDRPEWMDGGLRQHEMAARIKREIKKTRGRRFVSAIHARSQQEPSDAVEHPTGRLEKTRHDGGATELTPACSRGISESGPGPATGTEGRESFSDSLAVCLSRLDPMRTLEDVHASTAYKSLGQYEIILFMFYLERLLPFLYPFYRPSVFKGGNSWVMEMMIGSPVVRQATLCQASYFFSLARRSANAGGVVEWDRVLSQTKDAFEVLRQALEVIHTSDIREHMCGAVRVMASIMQVQRFDIAVLSFENCQAHLNAALALFRQLLGSADPAELADSRSSEFEAVMTRLRSSNTSVPPPVRCITIPTAEQAAFQFSSALLVFDDIIASTVLQEQPQLYEYYNSLLIGSEPPIDLEATLGCQNWVMLQIAETASVDAWKQERKHAGNLDVMELVSRATAIKDALEAGLKDLESKSSPSAVHEEEGDLFDIFAVDQSRRSKRSAQQTSLVSRVWAHAALLYLSVVVSGWQPARTDVRYHVDQVIELLMGASPPALLRTMVWPFCVAGCMAEAAREAHFRNMVEALQPPSIFGTTRKALDIMKDVWRDRDTADSAGRDLATCFRYQGELVLLV